MYEYIPTINTIMPRHLWDEHSLKNYLQVFFRVSITIKDGKYGVRVGEGQSIIPFIKKKTKMFNGETCTHINFGDFHFWYVPGLGC